MPASTASTPIRRPSPRSWAVREPHPGPALGGWSATGQLPSSTSPATATTQAASRVLGTRFLRPPLGVRPAGRVHRNCRTGTGRRHGHPPSRRHPARQRGGGRHHGWAGGLRQHRHAHRRPAHRGRRLQRCPEPWPDRSGPRSRRRRDHRTDAVRDPAPPDRILVLSSDPGRIKAELPVSLPRPRDRRDPAFEAPVDTVYGILTGREQTPTDAVGDSKGGAAVSTVLGAPAPHRCTAADGQSRRPLRPAGDPRRTGRRGRPGRTRRRAQLRGGRPAAAG